MWKNFESMPKFLKFLTAHAVFCFVFLVGSIIPDNSFSIDGRPVSYSGWWTSGAGPCASLIGVLGPLVAYSFLTKWRYARLAYLGFLAIAFVISPPLLGYNFLYTLVGMAFVGAGALCLYKWPSIRVYFTPNSSSKRTRVPRAA